MLLVVPPFAFQHQATILPKLESLYPVVPIMLKPLVTISLGTVPSAAFEFELNLLSSPLVLSYNAWEATAPLGFIHTKSGVKPTSINLLAVSSPVKVTTLKFSLGTNSPAAAAPCNNLLFTAIFNLY